MISLPKPKPLSQYGSREHYKQVFMDYVCELSDEGTEPENMFLGMMDAVVDMVEYHQHCIKRYESFSSKLEQLINTFDDQHTKE